MTLNTAGLNQVVGNGFGAFPFLSIHTSGPVSSSANESTAARVGPGGGSNSGVYTYNSAAFTGGTPNGPAIRIGYWTASTGGVYGGGALLSGDQTFSSAGTYTVTGVTITATSP